MSDDTTRGGGGPWPSFDDDPRPWEIVSSSYVTRREWFTVRRERVRLPTGAEIPEYWVSEYRPWINAVAVTANDEVVLLRQYRHGLGAVHFEIPGGTTDEGEQDLEAAARRECPRCPRTTCTDNRSSNRGRHRPTRR